MGLDWGGALSKARGFGDELPFSEAELVEAFSIIMTEEAARLGAAMLMDSSGETVGFTMTAEIYLLLSALSEDAATRVRAVRPELAERIDNVRRDPKAFIEQLRRTIT